MKEKPPLRTQKKVASATYIGEERKGNRSDGQHLQPGRDSSNAPHVKVRRDMGAGAKKKKLRIGK